MTGYLMDVDKLGSSGYPSMKLYAQVRAWSMALATSKQKRHPLMQHRHTPQATYNGPKVSSLSWNYAYTRAYTRTPQHQDDGALLKQVPYVPRQKWSLRFTLDYAHLFLHLQNSYVGVRYITTDQSYFTYPYNVTNLLIGYHYTTSTSPSSHR